MEKAIVGIDEFTAILRAMESNAADRIRAALLSLLDRGEYQNSC